MQLSDIKRLKNYLYLSRSQQIYPHISKHLLLVVLSEKGLASQLQGGREVLFYCARTDGVPLRSFDPKRSWDEALAEAISFAREECFPEGQEPKLVQQIMGTMLVQSLFVVLQLKQTSLVPKYFCVVFNLPKHKENQESNVHNYQP